jgi:ketosteroid isomerase-like protein
MNPEAHRNVSASVMAMVLVLTACSRSVNHAAREGPMETTITSAAIQSSARDHAAVTATVEGIARGADLHQWDAVRSAFAEQVELDYGSPEQLSPENIVSRWQPLLEAFDATQHAIHDLRIQIDGERATATSRFLATHVLRGAPGGDVWTLAGRYEHSLVRTPGGWKVTRLRMVPGESSGNTSLLDQALAQSAARVAAGANVGGRTARDRNRETVRAFFRQLEAMDTGDRFIALFTEDAKQVMPFAPEGFPSLLAGREAIRTQYSGLPTAYTHMRFPELTLRDMASPDEFFVTYRGDIGLKSGGRYENEYAGYFVVRDGRIVEFREFFNPIVLQQAFGRQLQETFNVKR